MRWWLVLVVACSGSRAPAPSPPPAPPPPHDAQPVAPVVPAHRPIALAVLGLESGDERSMKVAQDLTLYLRNHAREDGHVQLSAMKELVDEKLLNNCENEAPDCMAAIGRGVGADYVLYGHVGARLDVSLRLLDVKTLEVWPWNGVATTERAQLESLANGAYDELVSHVK